MKDYLKFMKWAVVSMTDRSTQEDRKSKIQIAGLFADPAVAEDLLNHNKDVKRYLLRVDDLERFEEFYNFIQDLNENYGDYAIYRLSEGDFTTDKENKFRQILGIWTDTKIA